MLAAPCKAVAHTVLYADSTSSESSRSNSAGKCGPVPFSSAHKVLLDDQFSRSLRAGQERQSPARVPCPSAPPSGLLAALVQRLRASPSHPPSCLQPQAAGVRCFAPPLSPLEISPLARSRDDCARQGACVPTPARPFAWRAASRPSRRTALTLPLTAAWATQALGCCRLSSAAWRGTLPAQRAPGGVDQPRAARGRRTPPGKRRRRPGGRRTRRPGGSCSHSSRQRRRCAHERACTSTAQAGRRRC